ncbi:hypothetical protein HDR58_03350 [bacterium]|nr:hypothetical protein [bacterium]
MSAKKSGGVDYGALVAKSRQTMQRQVTGTAEPETPAAEAQPIREAQPAESAAASAGNQDAAPAAEISEPSEPAAEPQAAQAETLPEPAESANLTDDQPEGLQFDVTLYPERTGRRRRGRPVNIQVRVPFTTRVRADVRKKINIGAATYDVKPSDIIDALVDQFWDALDWDKVGVDRH